MSKSVLLAIVIAGLVATQIGCSQQRQAGKVSESELTAVAREIQSRVITVDTHDDISSDFATEKDDPGKPENRRQVTLQKMRQGGFDAGFFIVYVGQGARTPAGYDTAYAQAIK